MLNFLIGGITGVMIASPPIDYGAHDSYFIVQHFHYTIGGGSMFALFGALYFWFPKMFGVKLDERLGRWVFALLFVGFNATFIPMGFMGMEGMARRVYTYPAVGHLPLLNAIATAGPALMAAGVVAFFVDVVVSARRRVPVRRQSLGRVQPRVDDVVAAAGVQLRGAAGDPQSAAGVARHAAAGDTRESVRRDSSRSRRRSGRRSRWRIGSSRTKKRPGTALLGIMAAALAFAAALRRRRRARRATRGRRSQRNHAAREPVRTSESSRPNSPWPILIALSARSRC